MGFLKRIFAIVGGYLGGVQGMSGGVSEGCSPGECQEGVWKDVGRVSGGLSGGCLGTLWRVSGECNCAAIASTELCELVVPCNFPCQKSGSWADYSIIYGFP